MTPTPPTVLQLTGRADQAKPLLPWCLLNCVCVHLVERWFRDLDDKAIRRGVFHSVPNLITAVEAYLSANNASPRPFVWTAPVDEILAKIRRGRVALEQLVPQN